MKKWRYIWSRVTINSNGLEVNTFCENMLSRKKDSGKVYTVVEDLCVEDTNVWDSCGQFLSDYKQLDLYDWIVKIEVVHSVHRDIFCVITGLEIPLLLPCWVNVCINKGF